MTHRSLLFLALVLCLPALWQTARADSTSLISVSSQETQGNFASSAPSISADGRFLAFASAATNLVPNDTNGRVDIFVRDRLGGTTRRVSVNSAGIQGNGDSREPAISGDGRFVTFISGASNLVPGDSPFSDVFVHDLQTGATKLVDTHTRIVCDPDHFCANEQDEVSPAISSDGRLIAFIVRTDDPVLFGSNLYLRDMNTAVTTLIAKGVINEDPAISADGRILVWECQEVSHHKNTFLCGRELSPSGSVVAKFRAVGNIPMLGLPQYTREPSVSGDGRFLAHLYVDETTDVPAAVYLIDRTDYSSRNISLSGPGYGDASSPSISANGRFVAYTQAVGNARTVLVWDRLHDSTQQMDVRLDGAGASAISAAPTISADGQFIAFSSNSNALVSSDTNNRPDVFVRDRAGRDDVLVDFGVRGLWQFMNNRRWTQVSTSSPGAIAAGDLDRSFRDEAFGTFPTGLLARYDNAAPWKNILSPTPGHIAVCDIDGNGEPELAADRTSGLLLLSNSFRWESIWDKPSVGLICGDLDGNGRAELIANFGADGIWARDQFNWTKLHPRSPAYLVAGDLDGNGLDDLVADFGGNGILVRYNNQTPWLKIRATGTRGLAVGDLDGNGKQELLLALPTGGLWVAHNKNVSQLFRLHPGTPKDTITADLDQNGKDEVLISLPTGLWVRYNNAGAWVKLREWPVQAFAAGGFD